MDSIEPASYYETSELTPYSIFLYSYSLFHRKNYRLLGVHAIGTGATELIHIGQAILRTDRGLDYFLTTVFNYPTLAECYKVAALDASNKLREG